MRLIRPVSGKEVANGARVETRSCSAGVRPIPSGQSCFPGNGWVGGIPPYHKAPRTPSGWGGFCCPAGMPEALPAPLGSAGTSKDSRTCAFGSSVTFRTAARTRAQAVGSRGTVPVCAGATDAPCALCPLSVSQTSPLLADATCQGPLPCSGSGVSGRVRRMRTGGPSLQAPRLRRLTPASPPCVRKRSPLWNDRV